MRQSALLLPILAVLAGGLFATPAWPQTYKPSRPIELVVHSAPGGGSDVFARAVVEMVDHERLLPQPIRVVNETARGPA